MEASDLVVAQDSPPSMTTLIQSTPHPILFQLLKQLALPINVFTTLQCIGDKKYSRMHCGGKAVAVVQDISPSVTKVHLLEEALAA